MTNNPGVNVGSYTIRTFDGRTLAYGPAGGDDRAVPPPARPVVAYRSPPDQPERFSISRVEQERNRYYINYLIERNNLLYNQVTAPQQWVITFVPVQGRIVFVVQTEDERSWVAPRGDQDGQIRVERIVYEDPPRYPDNVLFELIPLPN
ncbi:hypothetical protein EDD17DRAFT_1751875 [Pisolithus thermaeus]|nr:hypothetical protein EDD17DRAFT_1751875 [Pisolithus thermaeus]